jgi:hypothetical protein
MADRCLPALCKHTWSIHRHRTEASAAQMLLSEQTNHTTSTGDSWDSWGRASWIGDSWDRDSWDSSCHLVEVPVWKLAFHPRLFPWFQVAISLS